MILDFINRKPVAEVTEAPTPAPEDTALAALKQVLSFNDGKLRINYDGLEPMFEDPDSGDLRKPEIMIGSSNEYFGPAIVVLDSGNVLVSKDVFSPRGGGISNVWDYDFEGTYEGHDTISKYIELREVFEKIQNLTPAN